jgi:anti-anti-sigma factor
VPTAPPEPDQHCRGKEAIVPTGKHRPDLIGLAAGRPHGHADGQDWDSSLTIRVETTDTNTVVAVVGDLERATVPLLDEALASVDGGDMVIDLSELQFIDAAGIGALAHAATQRPHDETHVRVHVPSSFVRRVLTICDLDPFIESSDGDPSYDGERS